MSIIEIIRRNQPSEILALIYCSSPEMFAYMKRCYNSDKGWNLQES